MYCCVCVEEKPDGIDIFDDSGKRLKIAEIVQQHLWFEPQPNEELLSHICQVCWGILNDFHIFYQQAEQAHAGHHLRSETLIIKLETDEGVFGNESVMPFKDELADNTKGNVKEEEIRDNPLDEEHIKEPEVDIGKDLGDSSANVLRNPLDDIDNDSENNDDYGQCDKSEDDSSSTEESESEKQSKQRSKQTNEISVSKRGRPRKTPIYVQSNDEEESEGCDKSVIDSSSTEGDKPQEETTPLKGRKDKIATRRKTKRKISKGDQSNEIIVPKRKKKIRFNFDYKHTEEMIQKHIAMICSLCDFVGKTFSDIKNHFRDNHPQERPHVACCDKTFTKRFYLAQHALKHEDPNCFRCNECNKSFTTNRGLTMHNLNYHATEEERTFCCQLCPKKFATSNLLELHKPSHIPKDEWKFFCPQCPTPKAFASEFLMSVHLNAQHKRAANVCHVCAKEIRDKNAFEKHVSGHFEDSGPRLPCPYTDCDSWLKDEDNLKKHLRRRHNPNGIIYKCTECDKVCNNRGALTNHMHYSHSSGALFQCEQCDKSFKRAITLREHMTQHTGETLYTCPFCPRTFNSNANMYAHKKRNHPIEWEESRRNRQGSAQGLITKINPFLN